MREIDIIKKLQKNRHEAYYVGGYVRDKLLGRIPTDIDIATSATPEEVSKIFRNSRFVGESFGVSLVGNIEIATFRTERNYDGRKPSNTYLGVSLEEDASRRDFTFNALYLNPITNEIIDLYNGEDDIKRKMVRFIGNADDRIKEDNLRILRAVRFAATLNFDLDVEAKIAIIKNKDLLDKVSAERIVMEIKKCGNKFSQFVKMLDEFNLIDKIFGNITDLKTVAQNPRWHPEGDVWTHSIRVIDTLGTDDFVLNMAGLFHDFGKLSTTTIKEDGNIGSAGHVEKSVTLVRPILKKLKLTSSDIKDILWLIENHMRIKLFLDMKKSKKVALVRDSRVNKLVDLSIADSMIISKIKENMAVRDAVIELQNDKKTFIEPLVTGKDLIALDLKPGPIFKLILRDLFDYQINNDIKTKEELLKGISYGEWF